MKSEMKCGILLFLSYFVIKSNASPPAPTPALLPKEVTVNLITRKWAHLLNDKFLSFTLQPQIALEFQDYRPATMNMFKALSPAFLRLGGQEINHVTFLTDGINSHYTITDEQWKRLNKFSDKTKLDLIICVNPMERLHGVWQSRGALEFIDASDKLGYNLQWELGYELQRLHNSSEPISGNELGRDVVRLRKILDSFPRYSKSVIIGPDVIDSSSPEEMQFIKEFVNESGDALSALTWHPKFSEVNRTKEDVINTLSQIQHKLDTIIWPRDPTKPPTVKQPNKKEVWLSESSADDYEGDFSDALTWTKRLGSAAALGFPVFMKQISSSSVTRPTPDFWVSVLYKSLVGRAVLETKLMMGEKNTSQTFAHCTEMSPNNVIDQDYQYEQGAVTLFGLNLGNEEIKLNIKGNTKDESIHAYILTAENKNNFAETYMNGQLLTLSPTGELPILSPKIKNATRNVVVDIPPQSVYFLVLPEMKTKICTSYPVTQRNEIKENIEHQKQIEPIVNAIVTQDFLTKNDDNKKELYVRFGPKKHKIEVEGLDDKAENDNLMNLLSVTPESESNDEKQLYRLSKSISEMDLDNPVKSKTLKLSNAIKSIKNLKKESGKGSTLNNDEESHVGKEKELSDPIFNTKFILFSDDDWMSNFSHAKKAVEAAKKIIEAFDEAEMMKKHHESQQESVLQVENDKYHVQYGKDSLRKKKFAVLTASILEKENNTNNTNGIPTDKESMVNGNTIEDINHDLNTVANIDLMENVSHGRLKRQTMDAKRSESASNVYLHKQSVSKEYDKDFKNKIIKGKTDGMDTIKISEREGDKGNDSSFSDDQSYHPGEFYEYQNMPKNHVNHKPCVFEDLCEAELSAQNENEQVNPSNSEKEVSSMSVVSDNCKCKNDQIIKEGLEKELKNYYENAKKTVSESDDDENNDETNYDVYYKNNGKTGKNRTKRKSGDELNLKNQLILNNKKKLDHSKEMLTVHVRKPKSITKIEPRKTLGIKSKLSSTSKLVPRKEKLGKSITPSFSTKHLNKREVVTNLSDSKIQSASIEEDLLDKMINKVKNHPILGDADETTNMNKNDEKHEETNIPIIVNSVPINSLPDKNTKEMDSEIEKLDLKHRNTNDQSRTVRKNEDVTSEPKNEVQKEFLQDQEKNQDEGVQAMKKGKLFGELLGLSKGENDEENEWNEGKLDNANKELSKDKNDEEKMKWNESTQEQNKENDDMMKGNQSEKLLGNEPQENKLSHGEVDHNTALQSEVGTLLSKEHKADSAPLDRENTQLKDGFQRSSYLDSNSFDKKLKDMNMSEDAQSETNDYEEEDQIGTKDIDIVCGRTKHFGTFCIGSERKSDDINEENSSASSLSKLTPMTIFNKVGGPSEMHQNSVGLESNTALMNNILQTELNKQSEGETVLMHRREVTNDQLDDKTNAQDKEEWNEYLEEGTPTCKASRSAPYIEDFEELISQMRNLEKDSDNVRNRRLIHFTVPAVNVNHDKLTINDINEERPVRNSDKNHGDTSPDRSHDNHFRENEDDIRNGANENYNKGLKFKQYYEEDIKPSRQLKRTLLPSRRENSYSQHYKTHHGEPIDKDTYYDNLERNSRYRNRDDTEEEYYLNDNYKEIDGELHSTGYHQRKVTDYEADRYGSELDERDIYPQRANSHLRDSHLPEGMYGETSQWSEKRLPGDVYREIEGSETQIQRRQPYFVKSKPVPIIPAVMTSPDMFKPKFAKIGPHRNRRSIIPAFHNFQNDINNMMKNEMIQLEPFNYERKLQPRSPNIKKYYPLETGPSSLVHQGGPGTNHMNQIVKMTHYRKRSIPESENKELVNQHVHEERFAANRLIKNSNVNSDGINDKFDSSLLTDKGEFEQAFANKLGDLAKIYMAKENSKGYNIKDTDIGDLKFLTSFNEKYIPEVIVNELNKNGLNAATEFKQSVEEKENHSSELTDKTEHKNSLPNANMANNDITKMIAKAILLPTNNAPLNQINQNTFSYVVNQMKGFIQFVLQAIGQL